MTKKISTTKHIIIFDIDSTSIAGGLFRYTYTEKKELIETKSLYSLRKNITSGNEYPFDQFFNKTLSTLKAVAEEVYLQSLIPLDDIYCNVGTPWVNAYKKNISYKKDKPFLISSELIHEILEKELKNSTRKNSFHKDHDIELINRETLAIYGNGYKLRNVRNQSLSEITLQSLSSVMSQSTKESFSHIIEKVFHRLPHYLSNTATSYQYTQKSFPHINDTFIVDVSGEVTEVLVIQNDVLEHIGSIPVGEYGIIRSLRDILNIPFAKAKSILVLHHENNLDTEYSQSIDDALHTSFRVWFKEFFNLCDTYAKKGLLPRNIILRSHNDVYNWFEYMILEQDILSEHMHATGPIQLQPMFSQNIIPDVDTELSVIAEFIHHRQNKEL
jgi:hypothetical protein